jgi:hypothetical protein
MAQGGAAAEVDELVQQSLDGRAGGATGVAVAEEDHAARVGCEPGRPPG